MSRELPRYSEASEDASPEQAFLRTLIGTEQKDRPTDATMREIATRLGPILTSRRRPPRRATWQRLSVVAIAAALAMGGYAVRLRNDRETPAPHVSAAATGAERGNVVVAPTPDVRPDEAPASSGPPVPTFSVESLPQAPAPSGRTGARPACTNEVALLERADAALRSDDAATALAITREHAARCATGSFVQERERIAIEALTRLGRRAEMRERAVAFEERYPASPHLRRIRKLLVENPE